MDVVLYEDDTLDLLHCAAEYMNGRNRLFALQSNLFAWKTLILLDYY